MIDPLAEVVSLLRPTARLTKMVGAAGDWRVRRTELGEPFYCAVLDGECRLQTDGGESRSLRAGDFVLIPAARTFTMFGMTTLPLGNTEPEPLRVAEGEVRLGNATAAPDVRLLVGHCAFTAPDAALLVSLLPQVIHVCGEARLTTLVKLVGDEYQAGRPARDVILTRLLEVLFIEALRSTQQSTEPQGLLRGLADPRLAVVLRHMHGRPDHPWTVVQLAREAALSRSAFFERFHRVLGVAPMQYLLSWRMALAKSLLDEQTYRIGEVATRVGYASGSAFSVAFSRYTGQSPSCYARSPSTPSAVSIPVL